MKQRVWRGEEKGVQGTRRGNDRDMQQSLWSLQQDWAKLLAALDISVVAEGTPAPVVQECRDLSLTPAPSPSATVISVYHFLLRIQAPSP